ncbi:Oxysterol-binding protein 3 [Tilletia horrida]|uniref:Oxysterol-binding protein 3 n=1 Tax=Tilletia horrida TaxID=155126 RepID=A0AAN6JR48_9BASI|nr:Oxysterol-binding protein 3 [Tilletia horrida]KAK0531787.1 Oxysterol-binding protein 3 [Tilletia horrida]KAK0538157.1 Oxysterol-binding protein 3 [Tilletia horrida]KAK0561535.1 Oxysterol-binding protein 3 [Tilletia horrida]
MSPKERQRREHERRVQDLDIVHQGWVLKKKRKKMQGYAKRYLVLTREGLLTYALSPDKPLRDYIEIPHASVTSSKRHGSIHVDSGASVFHLKMLDPADFETWRKHLRSFIPDHAGEGAAQRIYVTANGGRDLVSINLDPLFESAGNMDALLKSIKVKVEQLAERKPGMADALTSMLNSSAKGDKILEELKLLVDNANAEHANLRAFIDAQIPKSRSGPEGTMESLNSRFGTNVSTMHRPRSRISISSFQTKGTDDAVFYDADAQGEEFILDDAETPPLNSTDSSQNGDNEETDDDATDEPKSDGSSTVASGNESSEIAVEHRTTLPSKVCGDEVSLFSMLKKNVGKDLSTVSFPVSFNCPLSLLQATAEGESKYEYAPDLLERAAKADDWVERICLVTAFAVSGYASTKLRASRKPFNPLLGETYECVREQKHMRFLAEKVVHQPPVVAFYAEGKGWKAQGWSSVKNKFWGKSLELIPEGKTRVEIGDDAFIINKPSSFMRNLLAGNKYLEHVGELEVVNENTGQRATVDFKEGNMWGGSASRNVVAGSVFDEDGSEVTGFRGRWSENLARQLSKDNYQVLWEASDMPPQAEDYYGFTYFAVTLNEITPDIKPYLPPTDSRLRPDQRAMENGDIDAAEDLKQKLEQAQRSRRKAAAEGRGPAPQPRWFHKSKEGVEWKYGGPKGDQYFKVRPEARDHSDVWDVPKIFEV